MSAVEQASMTLAKAIDVIEGTYEFMLAYAAQGRRTEEEDASTGIRARLLEAEEALKIVEAADVAAANVGGRQGEAPTEAFLAVLRQDAGKARAAIGFVLAQRSIGSQIIDNLNASLHVRALLTDIFLVDEALKISGISSRG